MRAFRVETVSTTANFEAKCLAKNHDDGQTMIMTMLMMTTWRERKRERERFCGSVRSCRLESSPLSHLRVQQIDISQSELKHLILRLNTTIFRISFFRTASGAYSTLPSYLLVQFIVFIVSSDDGQKSNVHLRRTSLWHSRVILNWHHPWIGVINRQLFRKVANFFWSLSVLLQWFSRCSGIAKFLLLRLDFFSMKLWQTKANCTRLVSTLREQLSEKEEHGSIFQYFKTQLGIEIDTKMNR